MKKALKWTLIVLVAALVVMQFFGIDKTNPPVNAGEEYLALANPPAEVATLMRQACYDCHSNETKYPWYTNVAPVSWWVKDHINEGRGALNFSVWGTYTPKKAAHKLEECYEIVQEGEMPLKSYTWIHSEARLTAEQKGQLVTWFKGQYQQMEAGKGENAAPSGNTENGGGSEQGEEEGKE